MALRTEIAIMGAGPAAVATACALRRLGHEVVLIGVSRNTAVEGVSERTLTLFREYGLAAAADSICGPGERVGAWAGVDLGGNTEYIVHRAQLDSALLTDAASSGVPVRAERVIRHDRLGALWRVHTEQDCVDCRVVIDARGRRAQRGSSKGPDLIAVSQRFRTRQTGRVFTRVEAIPQGWCWLAADGRGMSWLQVTSGREPSLRSGLEQHLRRLLDAAPGVAADLSAAVSSGAPIARAATQTLCTRADAPGLIRAGDAAVALDPLSGQGMYEALRSVAAVTGAVRGFLSGEWAPAARFMDERAREIWQRRSATAAHHYGLQAGKTPSPFWTEAAASYRSIKPAPPAPGGARIDSRPVLNGSRIELRRVVVTAQSPRGVWKVDAVDLPDLIDFLDSTHTTDPERAARHLCCPPAAVARALNWLGVHGLLGPAAEVRGRANRPDSE
jgi:menaquinone-9 beta-reductase